MEEYCEHSGIRIKSKKIPFDWQKIKSSYELTHNFRAKVIGGWIFSTDLINLVFIPDPYHEWDIE
jgi:hypothetical protein